MIDPPGLSPPETLPVSLSTTVPTEPPRLGIVVNVGDALVTITVSWLQALVAPSLLASPV